MKYFSTDTIPEFTVTEITKVVRQFIHETFYCIRVRGEVSGLSRPSSGHVYLVLKEENAIINAVCWNGTKLQTELQNGMEVICTGFLTTYQSKYQLIIEDMTPAGAGRLATILEERRKRLEKEGIFDANLKKALPLLPMKIGVITSPTGAVISDIIDRVQHRFPSHLIVWPVQVQGEHASNMVIDAIKGFNQMHLPPDVIIIARGGGSIEDLWPFNDELLTRTVRASKIPIVSAIGHETDFTLIDYAADLRAPTPTAAVEMILPSKQQLTENIHGQLHRIRKTLEHNINVQEKRLLQLHSTLIKTKHSIVELGAKIAEYRGKIHTLLQTLISKKQQQLSELLHRISYYDKQHLLSIGYTVTYDCNSNHIDTAAELSPNDTIIIEWKDGRRRAVILS